MGKGGMGLEIIGAESLGVRSLCCRVTLPNRRIVIDPGVALGYVRYGLRPHPVQIAVGRQVRDRILAALEDATDVVFSHFHADHVPLMDANPYQLSVCSLPHSFRGLRAWSKSGYDLTGVMRRRFHDVLDLLGSNMKVAEGRTVDGLSFSQSVPHGAPDGNMGTVMMTRVEMGGEVFVHASDIQLLDASTIDLLIDWRPDIVLAAGPPLYLDRLSNALRDTAWRNAVRLAQHVDVVILDHHLMRSQKGESWLDALSETVGRQVYCAADYMRHPRRLLEAERKQWYKKMPVPDGWNEDYAQGKVDLDSYFDQYLSLWKAR
ncbi:selenocysteine protein [Thiohalobacter thiocyanaticus]|uniref:Selenocysteine protein n=2 Tax=Thiohalobacter thiocyanaticus TaxID=585455 RepID=A0A1Z4VPU7_9GAMM|nr:selenocysteine protein [Thiohalobacter thiocyanaticus]